eukprot:scaffold67692_cov36-Cyclotella_meneghiniana.AAC.1
MRLVSLSEAMDEHLLLGCEKCSIYCHTYCLIPKLEDVPEEEWICARCEPSKPFEMWLNCNETAWENMKIGSRVKRGARYLLPVFTIIRKFTILWERANEHPPTAMYRQSTDHHVIRPFLS